LDALLYFMLENYWSLFLTVAIGLIIVEHPYLGICLSFVGFALAKHKDENMVETFSVDIHKHESSERFPTIKHQI